MAQGRADRIPGSGEADEGCYSISGHAETAIGDRLPAPAVGS
jgi:hypothetical protein